MLSWGKGQLYGNAFIWMFMPGWRALPRYGNGDAIKFGKSSSSPCLGGTWSRIRRIRWSRRGLVPLGARKLETPIATFALHPDARWLIVVAYLPTVRTITVNMASLKAPATAQWFDPSDGAYTVISGGPFANNGTQEFTSPGKNHDGEGDWVLLLSATREK